MHGICTRRACGLAFHSLLEGLVRIAHSKILGRGALGGFAKSVLAGSNHVLHVVEFVGYAARASAYNKTGRLMPYVVQNTFILLAPVLFAASIYMSLKKIILSVKGMKHSIIRPTWLTRLFVTGDVLTLMIQGGAAGMMIVTSLASLGQNLVVVGLVLSILMFGLFWATAAIFHLRMRKDSAAGHISPSVKWEQSLFMLYAVSSLIMVRSVFRVVEFVLGTDGYPLTHEWTLYIFDSIPMLSVMMIFWYWFPRTTADSVKRGSFYSVSSLAVFEPGPEITGLESSSPVLNKR
jgi:hypothetical protein